MSPRLGLLALAAWLPGCVPDQRPGEPVPARAASAAAPRPALPAARPALRTNAPAAGTAPLPAAAGDPEGDPPLTEVFRDAFDRPDLGPEYRATSPVWRIRDGRLCGAGARNHPLWLRRRLPANVQVEFDATSASPDGDLKVEIFGDGRSAAQTVSYTAATSYLAIFGGWKNTFHVLARIDEHAKDRPELRLGDDQDDPRTRRVEPNRAYRFKLVRDDGKTLRWFVDDLEILTFTDPSPLAGPGHDHLGFNDWEVPVCFDDLVVTPLP